MDNGGYKIVLIGDSGVGKSSIVYWFLHGRAYPNISPTIGAAFASKDLTVDNCDTGKKKRIKLNIWDTAGQERFRSITKMYYTSSLGCLVVFDVTDRDSFVNLSYWINDLKLNTNHTETIYIVANKIDIDQKYWKVSESEIKNFSNIHNYEYFFTSGLNGTGIEQLFLRMACSMSNLDIGPDTRRNGIISVYAGDDIGSIDNTIDKFMDKVGNLCC